MSIAMTLRNETASSITNDVVSIQGPLPSSNSCESEIKLFAYSTDFNRTGITHYHEGAGIDYLFLTGNDSPKYIFNKCNRQIYVLLAGSYKQYLSEIDGFVQLTVAGPAGDFALHNVSGAHFLSVDGETDGWQACKNTNDPYNFSKTLYQLTFDGHGYSDCIPVIVKAEYVQ